MGSYTCDIFVASHQSPEEFSKELETLLNIHLTPAINRFGDPQYEAVDEEKRMWLALYWNLHLVNDRDLLFENYNYDIDVGLLGNATSVERIEMAKAFAREIFEKFKATRKYPLMMVYDVQYKLDQYDLLSSRLISSVMLNLPKGKYS